MSQSFTFRLFMVHGQAAQKPTTNHISECVCLKLYKMYLQARDRPQDAAEKRLPIPQAIVRRYTHIKMLLENSHKQHHCVCIVRCLQYTITRDTITIRV